jgi:hypothetical protein
LAAAVLRPEEFDMNADDNLAVLVASYSQAMAAALARTSTRTVRRRLQDPEFVRKVADARREIRERLLNGVVEDLTGRRPLAESAP